MRSVEIPDSHRGGNAVDWNACPRADRRAAEDDVSASCLAAQPLLALTNASSA